MIHACTNDCTGVSGEPIGDCVNWGVNDCGAPGWPPAGEERLWGDEQSGTCICRKTSGAQGRGSRNWDTPSCLESLASEVQAQAVASVVEGLGVCSTEASST